MQYHNSTHVDQILTKRRTQKHIVRPALQHIHQALRDKTFAHYIPLSMHGLHKIHVIFTRQRFCVSHQSPTWHSDLSRNLYNGNQDQALALQAQNADRETWCTIRTPAQSILHTNTKFSTKRRASTSDQAKLAENNNTDTTNTRPIITPAYSDT